MSALDLLAMSGGYDEDMGYDDLMMGARRRRRAPVVRRGVQPNQLRQALVPAVPGAPSFGGRMAPMGLTPVTFTPTSGTLLNMTAAPNKAFKGSRLLLVVVRTAGAAAIAVTINSLNIGQSNNTVSAQPLPVEGFAPGAFQVELAMDPVTPGISVSFPIQVSAAPGAGESITVTGMVIGLTYT